MDAIEVFWVSAFALSVLLLNLESFTIRRFIRSQPSGMVLYWLGLKSVDSSLFLQNQLYRIECLSHVDKLLWVTESSLEIFVGNAYEKKYRMRSACLINLYLQFKWS